jgi:hypothetical protein
VRCATAATGLERREAEPVRDDEAREGGRPDRVGVEREPAKDDPRADQARRAGEEQDLPEAALDEGVVKRSEHVAIR